MLIAIIILVVTVLLFRRLRTLTKKLKPAEQPAEIKPLFQFKAKLSNRFWDDLKMHAEKAREDRRQELLAKDDEESKAELAQMVAEDEHDVARINRHFPQHITTLAKNVTNADCLVILRKEPGEKNWEAYERKHANAKMGAYIWLHTAVPYVKGSIRAKYGIVRVDTPARWERHTYFYHNSEQIESSYKRDSESYAEHDAAVEQMRHIPHKNFESCRITEKERYTLYRTKTVDEWRDFMRLHAGATIGSLIPFFEGTLNNDHGVRVIHAIHRVDTPARWEKHTYMFHEQERVPHA